MAYTKPPIGALLNPIHPLARGLIGCWLLGEGGGQRANDSSVGNNPGVLTNINASIWPGSHHGGQALSLVGTNQNVSVQSSALLQSPTTAVTICAWVFVPTSAGSQVAFANLAGKDYQSDPRGGPFGTYALIASNNTSQQYSFVTSVNTVSNNILDSGVAITKGVWTFVVGVMLGTTKSIYINGVLKATNASGATLVYSNGRFSIGSNSAAAEAFVGYIEGVRVYNRALSAAEVAWLYAEPYAGFISDDLDFGPTPTGAGVTGTIAATEANDVLAATGSVQTVGSIATTEAADVLAATGFLGFTGTIATTEANDTLAATGKVLVRGTAPLVEAGDVLAATGTVSQPAISGTIAVTEAGDTFAASGPRAAAVQVLNYGVLRRRREEYERREEEALREFAQEIAEDIDEGLPEPLRPADEPERASPAAEALEAAALALSRVPAALATDETATARIAAEIEARLRSVAAPSVAPAVIAAARDDYDDDEEAILALLLAA